MFRYGLHDKHYFYYNGESHIYNFDLKTIQKYWYHDSS